MKIKCLLLFVLFANGLAIGQPKKILPISAYDQWHRLSAIEISPDGKSFTYKIFSETSSDTLFVGNLKQPESKRAIINANKLHFLPEDRIAYVINDDEVAIENVNGLNSRRLKNVSRIEPLSNGQFLLLSSWNLSLGAPGTVHILNMKDMRIRTFKDIIGFSASNNEEQIVLSRILENDHSQVLLVSLKSWEEKIVAQDEKIIEHFSWSKDSKSVSYLLHDQANKERAVGYLKLNENALVPVIIDSLGDLYNEYIIDTGYMGKPSLFPEVNRLFFWVRKKVSDSLEEHVEIWNSHDQYFYPVKAHYPPYSSDQDLALYDLKTKKVSIVSRGLEEESFISPDGKFVLTVTKKPYTPEFLYKGSFEDVSIMNLETENSSLLLEKFPQNYDSTIQFSPSGNALLYFRDNRYWYYDLLSKKEIALSDPEKQSFDYYHSPDLKRIYEKLIWSEDGKFIITADQHDIWLLSTEGLEPQRLTTGKSPNITFRVLKNSISKNHLHLAQTLDLDEGFILKAKNYESGEGGYYFWDLDNGLNEIAFGNFNYSQLQKDNDRKFLFVRENFSTSPELIYRDLKKKKSKLLATSNNQQKKYYWGRSEMVHYNSLHNDPLRAALYYPANFQEGKKYPVIINIYEDTSTNLHKYIPPNKNDSGFNTTIYTLNGYFVLEPKLTYRRANPGGAASEDIDAALNYLNSTGLVDMERVGLYGHSFGGYEASFIATQSNRFATIVAGAPFTDLVSHYFSYEPLLLGPEFYRVELRQTMMSKDFFSSKESYLANSPVYQADHISCPLLLWHGKDDQNVSWLQSRELYFAMARQGKKCILLAYPGEDHSAYKKENAWDLQERLLDWYGHYLKYEPKSEWMK